MEAPQSPYRKGNWTITMLKQELKQRSLTLSGKKAELIERLEDDDTCRPSPQALKVRPAEPTTPRQSLSPEDSQVLSRLTVVQLQQELRNRGLSPVGKKNELVARLHSNSNDANEELTPKVVKPKSPAKPFGKLKVATNNSCCSTCCQSIKQFGLAVSDSACELASTISPATAISVGALLVFTVTFFALNGPHQQHLTPVKVYAAWYSKWFALGVLSTVGLGLGTFLLFLGPFVARCATAANNCKSVDYPVFGPRAFQCNTVGTTHHGILAVLNKVKWEVFVWGLGTAFGYLPAFMLSRYAGQRKAAPFLERLVPLSKMLGLVGFFYLASVTVFH